METSSSEYEKHDSWSRGSWRVPGPACWSLHYVKGRCDGHRSRACRGSWWWHSCCSGRWLWYRDDRGTAGATAQTDGGVVAIAELLTGYRRRGGLDQWRGGCNEWQGDCGICRWQVHRTGVSRNWRRKRRRTQDSRGCSWLPGHFVLRLSTGGRGHLLPQ